MRTAKEPTTYRSTAAKLVEESSDEEFNQLIASLPKHKGLSFNLHQFNGFWYSAHHLHSILHCHSHFRPLDSDVLLVTAPKSGTTWLKALVFSLFNRRRLDNPHPLTTQNPHELIPSLEINLYTDPNQIPDLSDLPSPRLFSTHIPASALPPTTLARSGCRIVYLCRDPRDTLISLWHFSNKLRDPEDGDLSLEEALDAFCNGSSDMGPFWDHILGYWNHSLENDTVMFLRYEELKGDTAACLRRLAGFVGCPFSEDEEKGGVVDSIVELCSFGNLSGLEVNKTGKLPHGMENKTFFRRGEVGDWLNYFTPEMTLRLDNLIKQKLHASEFNYF